ncbi:hypothetical protein R1flu_022780 [Riccia fluitans]|uniref:Glucose-6-phosphate dehydrogenase NAD-binding domain-containing protein n=1 Tax=Riccia fluitans TaxID=41844 RepID=A0ABD1XQV1_9MARC
MAYALSNIVTRSPICCAGLSTSSGYHRHAENTSVRRGQTPCFVLTNTKQKLGWKFQTGKPLSSGDVYYSVNGGSWVQARRTEQAQEVWQVDYFHAVVMVQHQKEEISDGYLPENVAIFGYSRSSLTDEDLRTLISARLTCRVDHAEECGNKTDQFLQSVFCQSGIYSTCEDMQTMDNRMLELEGGGPANRVFYLSVPSECLLEVATCLSKSAKSKTGWTRLIVEKPFGNDAESSAKITNGLYKAGFTEDQIFRIDHLLGKDLIGNLTVLRFSNLVFEPLLCRTYIKNVQIV